MMSLCSSVFWAGFALVIAASLVVLFYLAYFYESNYLHPYQNLFCFWSGQCMLSSSYHQNDEVWLLAC